jgi:hypothetical protein
MLVGYMRNSSESDRQTTDLQRDALLAAGIDDRHLFEDHASGAKDDRPGALKGAKQADDAEFYLSICEELGLLGVLVQPEYLFDVFTTILEDVKAATPGSFFAETRS